MTSCIVGIDLGTTHCCLAVYENDNPEIIVNALGERTTPSCVAFTKEGVIIGKPAKEQGILEPENTVYDIKRFIGLRYDNPYVQTYRQDWNFKVTKDNEIPKVNVKWRGRSRKYRPEEISAMLLKELKETAEAYLDKKVTKAVITVPAYFTDSQRQATLEAGKIAELDVVRLLNEPTAAALAYTVKQSDMRGTVLVFDLGGGTLDVSIVTITDSHFVVKATKGNSNLGGEDFTKRLFDYVLGFVVRSGDRNVLNDLSTMARVEQECEKAKQKLSFVEKHKIRIEGICNGYFEKIVTREKFCKLNADLFESILEPIKGALHAANITKDEIDKVITVGGSSRIPEIKERLARFFDKKEICSSINPDEAVAVGAAIYAAMYDGLKIKHKANLIIEDVIPRSLGIAYGKDFENTAFVIAKNSRIPISRNERFFTSEDHQTAVAFEVYEGESQQTRNNSFLGTFVITDVPPKPRGEEKFDVTFAVDSNGLLKVSAINISTGYEMKITIRKRFGTRFE